SLVPEVDTALQQLAHGHDGHGRMLSLQSLVVAVYRLVHRPGPRSPAVRALVETRVAGAPPWSGEGRARSAASAVAEGKCTGRVRRSLSRPPPRTRYRRPGRP